MIAEAKNVGLVGGPKNTVIRGRASHNLVKAAKRRTHWSFYDLRLSNAAPLNMAADSFFRIAPVLLQRAIQRGRCPCYAIVRTIFWMIAAYGPARSQIGSA